jgi:hypothetical protein
VVLLAGGATILLRPLASRLGKLLEVVILEKRQGLESRADLEAIEKRLGRVEERLEFTEELSAQHRRPALLGTETGE